MSDLPQAAEPMATWWAGMWRLARVEAQTGWLWLACRSMVVAEQTVRLSGRTSLPYLWAARTAPSWVRMSRPAPAAAQRALLWARMSRPVAEELRSARASERLLCPAQAVRTMDWRWAHMWRLAPTAVPTELQ